MSHSSISLSGPSDRRPDGAISTPQVLVGGHEDSTSSGVDLTKTLATNSSHVIETDNIPPLLLEPIRKRSEMRLGPAFKGEELELSFLPSLPEGIHSSVIQSGTGDIEVVSRFPDASATSVRAESEANRVDSVLSPAQQANQRWKGRFHFAAVCYCYFLEGWNDGSTGPLIPTVQSYYNV